MRTALALLLCAGSLAASPRLILTPERAAQLREAVRRPGTPHARIFALLKRQVESESWFDPSSSNWNYGRAYHATAAAFLYQLSGEKQYCTLAFQTLSDIHAKPDPERRLPEEGYGLSRATVGAGFAFAYDWCGAAWMPVQRAAVRAVLLRALDLWPAYRHANLEAPHRGSNWVSVCRGGELVMLVGAGLEKERAARYDLLKDDLRRHMRNFDELGVTQEGVGYTGYGGIFLLKALLALRALGDNDLEAEAAAHAWWKQAMYAGSFAAGPRGGRVFLMSGVGGPGIGDEGWASLLLAFVPEEHQGHFLFWYERHAAPEYDPRREGRVWALLNYPLGLRPDDPTGRLPVAVTGRAGLTLFRERWRDASDILVSLHADTHHHSHAWDQPEALQINLFADGRLWLGGPNKEREARFFSKPLIDGRHGDQRLTGEAHGFGVDGRRAWAAAAGGEQYRALGATEAVRRVEVDFSGNPAVIRVRDKLRSAEPRRFTWNGRPGDEAMRAEFRGREFVLRSADGRRISGRVLGAAEFKPGRDCAFCLESEGSSAGFDLEFRVPR
jgi:hypothetical protein